MRDCFPDLGTILKNIDDGIEIHKEDIFKTGRLRRCKAAILDGQFFLAAEKARVAGYHLMAQAIEALSKEV